MAKAKESTKTKESKELKNAGAAKGERDMQPISGRVVSPFDEMERMIENTFGRGWMSPFRLAMPGLGELGRLEQRLPRVDVVERDDEVVVHAEVPGVDKKDLEVSTSGDTVTIRGSTRRDSTEANADYYRREISSGSFSRTVALPCEVAEENAKAKFKDGVLELVLPKSARARRRSIPVD